MRKIEQIFVQFCNTCFGFIIHHQLLIETKVLISRTGTSIDTCSNDQILRLHQQLMMDVESETCIAKLIT